MQQPITGSGLASGKTTHARHARISFIGIVAVLALGAIGLAVNAFSSVHSAAASVTGSGKSRAVAAAEQSDLIVLSDGTILDANTGSQLHRLSFGSAGTNLSLDFDAKRSRLFVADTAWENGRAVDYVTVYRVADWSIEHRIPVPDIIRYNGNRFSGVASSLDGRFLYVYNYNDRTRGSSPVRYWLKTFDLVTGAWLFAEVDLPGCDASQLFPGDSQRIYVLCHGTRDIRVVGPTTPTTFGSLPTDAIALSSKGSGSAPANISAATLQGGAFYVVTDKRDVHVMNADSHSMSRVFTSLPSTQKLVPIQPVAVDASSTRILIPMGTTEERSLGIASEIAVVDRTSGNTTRILKPSQSFRWVTFDSARKFAYLAAVGINGSAERLIRLNLQTGEEKVLFDGPLAPGFVVSS